MMNSSKKITLILLIFFSLDFFLTKFFFKNTIFWKHEVYQKKPWRIISKYYHHDLEPLINVLERWGANESKLITNSLGFRDYTKRNIEKKSLKSRVLLVGDSFIEGLGYDYEYTLSGLLTNHYKKKYDILNSAVASYSPSIYYFKTKYLLDQGYIFDHVLVFLDISDIIDENYLTFNSDNSLKIPNKNNKQNKNFKTKFYNFGKTLKNNFASFKLLYLLSDKAEIIKNNLKNKYKASKTFDKTLLSLKSKENNLYKMINVDRGNWTQKTSLSKEARNGLLRSEKSLLLLFNMLKKNNIKSHLIIYPWPSQIFYEDHHHKKYWINFAKKENINLINLYPYFDKANKSEVILKNFITDDVHWNKKGTVKVFEALKENKILDY